MPEEVLTDVDILDEPIIDEPLVDEPEVEEPEIEETDEEKEAKEKDEDKVKKIDEDKPFPYERPSIGEIKAKFPDFFKEFPIFRDVVFREIEYTKLYPTIEDAKEAQDDSLALTGLRESVLEGKSEDIFNAIEQTDKKAATRFATTFLPTLFEKHNELYVQAITPVLETLVRKLAGTGNENSRNAALVIAEYLWPNQGEGIVNGTKTFARNTEESEEEKRIKEERTKWNSDQYEGFKSNVLGDLGTQRRSLISRGLDPQKTMTEGQREMLIERIEKLVDQALVADTSHMSTMNARWLRSRKEGYNQASKEKIVSAYLSRAKQVIPSIRDKERDAFFGTRKKVSQAKSEEIDNKSSKTKEVVGGRVSAATAGKEILKPSRDLYRKMSDIDILNTN